MKINEASVALPFTVYYVIYIPLSVTATINATKWCEIFVIEHKLVTSALIRLYS